MAKFNLDEFLLPAQTPFNFLQCQEAFNKLSITEKVYAHYMSEASWCGGPICLLQTSPESPPLFILAIAIFTNESIDHLHKKAVEEWGISEDDVNGIFLYLAAFFGNLGNYKSFGDIKFIPRPSKEVFSRFVENSAAVQNDSHLQELWKTVVDQIYSHEEQVLHLGFHPHAINTYFSSNCTQEDCNLVLNFLNQEKISGYNTRLFKNDSGEFVVLQAASDISDVNIKEGYVSTDSGDNFKICVKRGDYCELMQLMVNQLEAAKSHALNDHERDMLKAYIDSFKEGSIDKHKEGSRYWINDVGPIIESYIGFIESYRDPQGVRGEFEGFVAVVNKDTSLKFGHLVDAATKLLPKLPWAKEYEKDKFLRPDFTSLDVLAFATSGVPAGINIPNYDDIRQDEGFKNVSLQNVLSARFKEPTMTFLKMDDKVFYKNLVGKAFEIQVGLHELLGHGSGKLFNVDDSGHSNFNKDAVIDVVTGKEGITSWYKPGETWDSLFKSLASPFEECRAEAVGIYLCDLPEVLSIFGHEEEAKASQTVSSVPDVVYINWLSMARSGLVSLEMYQPAKANWGQAHSQARFVILQVMLEAGQDFVKLEECQGSDGNPDILIHLDRSKIISVGKPAVGQFLKLLQYYKSTANVKDGTAFFTRYSSVNDQFQRYRDIVFKRREPRPLLIQGNTFLDKTTGAVSYVTYDTTAEGMIQSFVDRYRSKPEVLQALDAIWQRDRKHFGMN
jgi:dipeptidyl-peptidase III